MSAKFFRVESSALRFRERFLCVLSDSYMSVRVHIAVTGDPPLNSWCAQLAGSAWVDIPVEASL